MADIPFDSFGYSRDEENSPANRILIVVVLVLAVILAGEIIFHVYIAPGMVIKNVRIKSGLELTNEQILESAGLSGKLYYFGLDTGAISKSLMNNPAVRSAIVKKQFPDTLIIRLEKREPLGMLFVELKGGSVPVLFDKQGVLYAAGVSASRENVPVIEGLVVRNLRLGVTLPGSLKVFLEELSVLQTEEPVLYNSISEIILQKRAEHMHEISLYVTGYKPKAIIGEHLTIDTMKYVIMVMDIVKERGLSGKMDEVDFRTSDIVFKMREG